MNRTPVKSSNIKAVGYDQETYTIEVEFHTGGIYQYTGVPEQVYRGFMQSASKGSYFHDHIRNRYAFKQVG